MKHNTESERAIIQDMKASTLDITEARNQFNRLDERLQDDRVIYVTRHNKEVFAVVDIGFLSVILETIEIMSDPKSHQMLIDSIEDVRANRLHNHEDVKRELL